MTKRSQSFGRSGRQDKGILKDVVPGSYKEGNGVLQTPVNRREKRSHAKRLKKYLGGKGTFKFTPDEPKN